MEEAYHCGPVSSLKFVPGTPYLLVGYGPLLRIYNHETGEITVEDLKIFEKNKIHGIAISSDNKNILFYGGRSLSIISFEILLSCENVLEFERASNDWVISGSFSYDDENKFYLLTAHNIVIEAEVFDSKGTLKVLGTKDCNEKSILYSGNFKILNNNKILVFAGTVMAGIFVWEIDILNNSTKILHHLTGHEGSIFGVVSNEDGTLIASCSDDRSIKIWDSSSGENLATGWGHGARIWYLEFYDSTKILSCSEDLTMRTWDFKNNKKELICVKVMETHSGKNLWSGAINSDMLIAATGGNEGRVRLVDLKNFDTKHEELSLDALKTNFYGLKFSKNENIKDVVSKENIDDYLLITSDCKIFHIGETIKYLNDEISVDLDSFSNNFFCVSYLKQSSLIILTHGNGTEQLILTLDFELNITNVKPIEIISYLPKVAKITNIFNSNENHFIFESPNPQDPLIYAKFDSKRLEFFNTIKLIKPNNIPRFTITSFEYCQSKNYVIFGSRHATLTIYDLDNANEPIKTFKKFTSGDSISELKIIEETEEICRIWITIRDGSYFVAELNFSDEISYEVLQSNKISKGGFLEGGIFDKDLLLYGFKSDYFYLYNETNNYEIFTELCGGSHRLWKIQFDSKTNKFTFFYVIKSKTLVKKVFEIGSSTSKVLIPGFHGREVRDISINPKLYKVSDDLSYRILMTGSEDCTVKLSKMFYNNKSKKLSLKNINTQRLHVSGLQSLKFLDDQLAISCAAREEFYIWKIHNNNDKMLVTCYDSLKPSVEEDPDLRIMDFDYVSIRSNNCIIGYLLCLVYSNSQIKVFHYVIKTKKFILLNDHFYKDICLLNVRFLVNTQNVFITVGATDGFLTIYKLPIPSYLKISGYENCLLLINEPVVTVKSLGRPIITQQIHQNGIKAFTISSSNYVITGGDDNALSVFKISFNENDGKIAKGEITDFIPSAASSTITSISIYPDGLKILVTSVDQIIRIYELKDNKLLLKNEKYTTIGDTGPSDITTFGNEIVSVVGGVGTSILKV